MMEYKGYSAKVEFDSDANIFHGEVINLRDVITFEGETVKKLKQAFQDSVDDYLDFCAQRGEAPEKPYSGKFVIRVEPELHKNITIEARKAGKSLNVWISDAIYKALKDNTQQGHSL
ncbi:MAG TPA: toxin-antitoxin system HicB family antitoxin [Syntrophus sp. (in: bacteria)]|nr:toxin-antitoxin system HicB family antitoxin [Syntrophus sp. (in: bacteria)]